MNLEAEVPSPFLSSYFDGLRAVQSSHFRIKNRLVYFSGRPAVNLDMRPHVGEVYVVDNAAQAYSSDFCSSFSTALAWNFLPVL